MSSTTISATSGVTRKELFTTYYVCTAEEDVISRELLTKIGFDLDDVNKKCLVKYKHGYHMVTPMVYFSVRKNKRLCQYLFSLGADCTMFEAANYGHLEICQFLLHHGGVKDDIRKKYGTSGITPLRIAIYREHFEVVKLLILNDALSLHGADGVIDDATMRNHFCPMQDSSGDFYVKRSLLSWARNAMITRDNMKLFLKGTIIPSSCSYKTSTSKRMKVLPSSSSSSSSLVIFNGQSGILELIAAYAGPKTQDVPILRQLMHLLAAFIAGIPVATSVEEKEEEKEEEEEEPEEEESEEEEVDHHRPVQEFDEEEDY